MALTDEILGVHPTGPLYHYTSAAGILGILGSGRIWATHLAYLNDTTEFLDAMRVVREVIADRKGDANSTYYKAVSKHLGILNERVVPNTYVSSFCEAEDELSLWRGYCPHNAGYAFGYDWRQNMDETSTIAKCVYDDDLKRSIIEEQLDLNLSVSIDEVRKRYEGTKVPADLLDEEWCAISFTEFFYVFAPAFKNTAFKQEGEWRLIVMKASGGTPQDEKHRVGQTMLIPYVEHSLLNAGALQVAKIVVGPTAHPLAAGHVIERFLQRWALGDNPFTIECEAIKLSNVPYRHV